MILCAAFDPRQMWWPKGLDLGLSSRAAMRMQFAVWDCDFEKKGLHPAVLISHPDRSARAQWI